MLSFNLWYQVLEDDEDMAMMYLTMYQEVKQTVLRQQSRDITSGDSSLSYTTHRNLYCTLHFNISDLTHTRRIFFIKDQAILA